MGGLIIMTQTIEERVQARLDSWALRYDVNREQHQKYSKTLTPSMITMYSNVPRGEKPNWMDELGFECVYSKRYVAQRIFVCLREYHVLFRKKK